MSLIFRICPVSPTLLLLLLATLLLPLLEKRKDLFPSADALPSLPVVQSKVGKMGKF